MKSEADIEAEAIESAKRILSGKLGIIEGARLLAGLRNKISKKKESLFYAVIEASSDSDHLPLGESRRHWSAEALEQKDKEIKEFEENYRDDVLKACQLIVSTKLKVEPGEIANT